MFENPSISPRRRATLAASVSLHAVVGAILVGAQMLAIGEPPEVQTKIEWILPRPEEPIRVILQSKPLSARVAANRGAGPQTPPHAVAPVSRIPDGVAPVAIPDGTDDADELPLIGQPSTGTGGDRTEGEPGDGTGEPGIYDARSSFVTPPVALSTPDPAYPDILRRGRVGGYAVLEAIVESDGSVREVRVLRGSHPMFEASALEAVKRWRYRPGFIGARAVPVYLTVTVTFRTA